MGFVFHVMLTWIWSYGLMMFNFDEWWLIMTSHVIVWFLSQGRSPIATMGFDKKSLSSMRFSPTRWGVWRGLPAKHELVPSSNDVLIAFLKGVWCNNFDRSRYPMHITRTHGALETGNQQLIWELIWLSFFDQTTNILNIMFHCPNDIIPILVVDSHNMI